jgi:hypothetical protein
MGLHKTNPKQLPMRTSGKFPVRMKNRIALTLADTVTLRDGSIGRFAKNEA